MDFLGIAGFAHSVGGWIVGRFRRPEPVTQIIVQPGAAYIDFRGASGEFHVHLKGPAEVVSTKPLRIVEAETIDITESLTCELRQRHGMEGT